MSWASDSTLVSVSCFISPALKRFWKHCKGTRPPQRRLWKAGWSVWSPGASMVGIAAPEKSRRSWQLHNKKAHEGKPRIQFDQGSFRTGKLCCWIEHYTGILRFLPKCQYLLCFMFCVTADDAQYLLVRPYPSLRVLFASSELEAVGVTQRPLTSLIGGSARVRQHLTNALEIGRKVTAKVVWKCGDGEEDRLCWIHCTPLLGANNVIGVWMIILVDTDESIDNEDMTKPPTVVPDYDSFAGSTYSAAITPWDHRIPTQSIGGLSSTGRTRVRSPSSGQTSLSSSRDVEYRNGSRRNLGDFALAHHFQGTQASSGGDPISLYRSKADTPALPLRDEMQPKTRKQGQSSQLTAGTKLPINLPGDERNQDLKLDNPMGRRTYKSLSPYGVLFQNWNGCSAINYNLVESIVSALDHRRTAKLLKSFEEHWVILPPHTIRVGPTLRRLL